MNEHPYIPINGIRSCPIVSIKTNPGRSQGKPPSKINLSNSTTVKTPAHNKE